MKKKNGSLDVNFKNYAQKFSDNTNNIVKNGVNEINKFVDARYVSASEAVWRIFGFDVNQQAPHTIRLPVHLEHMQTILFKATDKPQDILEKNKETQLTQFFEMNKTDEIARQLNYYEMPLKFLWNRRKKKWTKRKK